jgi:hypothetical protein
MNLANHKIHYIMKDLMTLKKLHGAKVTFTPHELLFFIDMWEEIEPQILPIKNQMITDIKKEFITNSLIIR